MPKGAKGMTCRHSASRRREVTHLTISIGLVLCLLAIEVLEVGIDGSLLGLGVLEKDGSYAVGLGGRLAVHGLVEGGIALLVFLL